MSAVPTEEIVAPEFFYVDEGEVTDRARRKHDAFLEQQLGLSLADRGSTLVRTNEALRFRQGQDGVKTVAVDDRRKVVQVTVTSLKGTFVFDTYLGQTVNVGNLKRRAERISV